MYPHSAKGLHRFDGIKSFAGTLNELAPPTEVPESQVIKCLNFKAHADGISRVKRLGYSKFDTLGIAASAHRARTSNVATIGTASAHGLVSNDGIIVSGMSGTGYNGTWVVASVPDTTHFTYANTGTNETETADTAGTITFKKFGGLPIRGLFDYWDETPVNRYAVITSKKIFSRAVGAGSWSELYSQATELAFPVKPVVYLRERPIVVGFDTNRLVEPTTTYGLGIEAPTGKPTLAPVDDGKLTGTYKYVITYFRSGNYQTESNPSDESLPITVTAKKIKLSSIPVSGDPKVDKKRIYRTTEGGAVFFWVADIEHDTVDYEDNITELGDEVSYDRYPPPVAICAESWDDKVWFVPKSDRNQLQFTNTGYAEEMAYDNIIQVKGKDSDEIMTIKAYMDSLYILKHRSIWRLDKVGESSYLLTRLPFSTGTDAPATVAVGGGLMMWLSKRGIEVFNDQVIFEPPVSSLIPTTAASIYQPAIAKSFGEINEKECEYWLAVPTGTSAEPNLILVFDYIRAKTNKYEFAKNFSAMHNIRDANSKLQFITGSSDGNLYVQSSGYTDDSTPIEAEFMTRQYCSLTDEKGLWNVLRRLFAEYICPTGSKVILNIYKNQEKIPFVSVSLEGGTPSDLDEARRVIMRRVNLGVSCAYFCLEFIHDEIADGEVRILTPEIYFKRRVWKKDIEAD